MRIFALAVVAVTFALSLMCSAYADLISIEDFEDNTGFTATQFGAGSGDYFTRTDGSDITVDTAYTNVQGTFFFAGQDQDGGGDNPSVLTISDIDISSYVGLEFRGFFAEADANNLPDEDIDSGDFLLVEIDIDSAGFSNLIAFENDGSTFNSAFFEDTNLDGDGEGSELTNVLTEFTKSISGTGSTLSIRFTASVNSGDEDFAIDNFSIHGTLAAVPEPSAFLFGGLVCGVLGVNYARRRKS